MQPARARQMFGPLHQRSIALVSVVAVAVAAWVLRWPALGDPLSYDGDTLFVWGLVKTLASHSWAWHNADLGLPGTLAWVDFPMAFVGQMALLKGLTAFGLAPMAAINTAFFLSFALTGAIAAGVLLSVHISPALAVLGALSYALLPYHFMRMPAHLFLSAYYLVPVLCAVVLFQASPGEKTKAQLRWCALVCAGAALVNDVYYTFFFCYLAAAVGALSCLRQKRLRPLVCAGVALVSSTCGLMLAMAPTLWSRWKQHVPQAALIRPANDSENYGLKFIQMLLPAPNHLHPTLAKITQGYATTAPLVNENTNACLGLVLSVALVTSMGYWLVKALPTTPRAADDAEQTMLRSLGVLTLLAFLYGTVGGFGTVFAYGVMPYIRSTNRVVVFIAFFVLLTGCLLAQRLRRAAVASSQAGGAAWACGIAYVLAVATLLWDAHDTRYFPRAEEARALCAQDRAFFRSMEAEIGVGRSIFQLPYVAFPEGGYQHLDYSQLTPYLHTQGTRYSFGAMRGTAADLWNQQTAGMFAAPDWPQLVRRLKSQDFRHVLLNQRLPMADRLGLLTRLIQHFGPPILRSPDNTFVLFELR